MICRINIYLLVVLFSVNIYLIKWSKWREEAGCGGDGGRGGRKEASKQ
jgi:hypothetical protein